jgi:hypothetical protein
MKSIEQPGIPSLELAADKEKEIFDDVMRELISSAKVIDGGNNGVIGLVSLEDIPNELKKEFGIDVEELDGMENLSLKMFKIYNQGEGRREFENHK